MTRILNEIKMMCICGNGEKVTIYDSVNVTNDPQLLEKVMKKIINMFICSKCGKNEQVHTFLYHDMNKKLAVYCYPTVRAMNYDSLSRDKGRKEAEQLLSSMGTDIRVVVGQDDLIRLIRDYNN